MDPILVRITPEMHTFGGKGKSSRGVHSLGAQPRALYLEAPVVPNPHFSSSERYLIQSSPERGSFLIACPRSRIVVCVEGSSERTSLTCCIGVLSDEWGTRERCYSSAAEVLKEDGVILSQRPQCIGNRQVVLLSLPGVGQCRYHQLKLSIKSVGLESTVAGCRLKSFWRGIQSCTVHATVSYGV